jgi:hypothetical protein
LPVLVTNCMAELKQQEHCQPGDVVVSSAVLLNLVTVISPAG